jgi:membrane-bound metal-dependent hydrolase YbcI (DUF457 family)
VFLGHFAAGLAASRAEPRLPLGTAFLAAQLPDVLWPYLLVAGVEEVAIVPGDTVVTPLRFVSYPWSHSLVMVITGALLAAVILRTRGRSPRVAALVAALVVSHWVLDAASHRPDMPLYPGGPCVGLGMWNSLPLTLAVELGLFAAGIWAYARGRRMGWGFGSLCGTLAVVYLANVFGPPPPSVIAVAISGIVAMPLLWWWGNRVSYPPTGLAAAK